LKKHYILHQASTAISSLDAELQTLNPVCLDILSRRGFSTSDKIRDILVPSFKEAIQPLNCQDIQPAILTLAKAIQDKQPIVVYRDYDVDGITAGAVAVECLSHLGADVHHYVNRRETDGFGVCKNGIDNILKLWPDTQIILTVDNGINGTDAVKYANARGLTVVITDHHEPGDELPPAAAVVDLKRKDETYPFRDLCGCGVIFRVMLDLYRHLKQDTKPVLAAVDLVTLATVADVVPLLGENRALVKHGIPLIEAGKRPFFRAMLDLLGVREVNAHYTLGFQIAPVLNSLSRNEWRFLRFYRRFSMANLDAIYEESGLQGVIPYGFGMDGQGYRFLCGKLKEGVSFYVIASPATTLPYFFADNEHIYFNLYTTEEMASSKCDSLAMDKRYTVPALLETEGWTSVLWRRYRDLGATHIRIDKAVWISISDLTTTATYEGIINYDTPLRNPTLNAIMYSYQQNYEAGACPDALTALYWETVKKSLFYAPLRPTRPIQPGETLNAGNSDFHYIELEDGSRAFLLFTDDDFKNIYAESYGLKPEEFKVVNLFNFNEIREFLASESGLCALVNHMAGNFVISTDLMDYYETISLNEAARKKGARQNP